jgi:hypothetical protein
MGVGQVNNGKELDKDEVKSSLQQRTLAGYGIVGGHNGYILTKGSP